MIEINDSDGRLIVVLPIRLRHAGRIACVFVNENWATLWAPQASGSQVLRYNPCTGQAEHN